MNKKGAVISLEALVKFIPVLLIAIVGLYVLFTIWGSFFQEEISAAEYDMMRVKNNLASISKNEKLSVFTKGETYKLVMLPIDNSIPQCGGKACLCVYDMIEGNYMEEPTKCEPLPEVGRCPVDKKSKFTSCFGNTESVEIKNTNVTSKEFVNICKDNNEKISIKC